MYLSIKEEQYEAIKRLPEEKQGKMLLVMGRYIFEGVEPSMEDDPMLRGLFQGWKNWLDGGIAHCEKNIENGKKGGRPKKEFQNSNVNENGENSQKPSGFSEKPKKPSKTIGQGQLQQQLQQQLQGQGQEQGQLQEQKKEREKEKKSPPSKKILFGDKVYLTREEHESLKEKFGEYKTNKYITNLDLYIQSTGKVYKSHYATIRMWFNRDGIREIEKKEAPPPVEKAEISEEERAKNREIVQKMRKTFLTPKQVE